MSDSGNRLKIPVACLRPGLYVDALDRPWLDTPFLFQGFEILEQSEVRALGHYCSFVYVDAERSRADELAAARHAASERGDPDETEARGADAGAADRDSGTERRGRAREAGSAHEPAGKSGRGAPDEADPQRFPSGDRFRELVGAAKSGRDQARNAVDRVMQELRFGTSVDTEVARKAVEDLVDRVSADASAALWLTNLKNRDEYTSIHCVNVCVLALAFGVHLGLEREALIRLGTGALLHDVGKTRTPDEILNKEGPLTAEEYEVIKRHAEDGYRLLREAGGTTEEVLQIVRLHHERMSGTGYPLGLEGEHIPEHVRIVGLVDTYDAMTSDRAYRDAISADDALHELYRHAAEEFGADLVASFIRCLGIFPVGSVVELDNGAVGVVIATRDDARLQPTLLMVRTPDGAAYERRLLVNLSARADAREGEHAARRIARSLTPSRAGVDVARIVSRELGVDTPA